MGVRVTVTADSKRDGRTAVMFFLVALCWVSCTGSRSSASQQSALASPPTSGPAVGADDSGRVQDLVSEAIQLEDAGKFQQAIDKHQEIVRLRPREVRSINAIGGLNGKLGRFFDELDWTDRAIAVDPRFAPAWVNRGNALGSLGRLDEADAAFVRAIQLDPKLPEAHNGRGVVADAREDFETALRHYREAVNVAPRFEDGWFSMAAALANLHRFDEAIVALKRVLELNPHAEDAKAMLTDLKARVDGANASTKAVAEDARATPPAAELGCRQTQGPTGPIVECAAFDLIVSTAGRPLPLATLSKVLSAGGVTVAEGTLTIDGSPQPALRLKKRRSDGETQIGWATIVAVRGIERNVTCYLRPPHTDQAICSMGLSQLTRGQLPMTDNP